MASTLFFILMMVCFVSGSLSQDAHYILGAGIADITGPAADANLVNSINMHMINCELKMNDIHDRLFKLKVGQH